MYRKLVRVSNKERSRLLLQGRRENSQGPRQNWSLRRHYFQTTQLRTGGQYSKALRIRQNWPPMPYTFPGFEWAVVQAGHKLHKIFNRNTVKVSYSCVNNVI